MTFKEESYQEFMPMILVIALSPTIFSSWKKYQERPGMRLALRRRPSSCMN